LITDNRYVEYLPLDHFALHLIWSVLRVTGTHTMAHGDLDSDLSERSTLEQRGHRYISVSYHSDKLLLVTVGTDRRTAAIVFPHQPRPTF
jgi:hypothetical protein